MNTTDHKRVRSTFSFLRKAGRIMSIFITVLLVLVLLLVGVLELWSYPGRPQPFLEPDGRPLMGSISEKVHVRINGVEQGMFIIGKDVNKPVLLYLHGGIPDYFLTQNYPTGLEDQFVVVWWEQRGSGISYSADIPRETMTLERMISDTIGVTNYLRQRFGREKIYLMGHSGGTFIGIQAAAREPQLYYAYIGVAQMSNQLESERLAYDYMLKEFKASGNTKMVQNLEAAPVTLENGTPDAYRALRDPAMHGLGIGTMHNMRSIVSGLLIPSFQFRQYTLKEKIDLWRGKASSGISCLWNEMITTDLTKEVSRFELPVYFMSGAYDYTVNHQLSKDYFDKIQAPVKGFYTFEQSAHSPMFEETGKMQRILEEDVLTSSNDLADAE